MFQDNKYTHWYFRIIDKALARAWTKDTAPVYVESHHVIPKSIKRNGDVVCLTAREHYVCHLLLPKMCIDKNHKRKMDLALHRLIHGNGGRVVYCKSSIHYQIIKTEHSKAASSRSKDYWATLTPEVRSVMRSGENNGRYGKPVYQGTRDKIGSANKGRLAGNKHPLWNIGHTEESKAKMRGRKGSASGKKWYNNGIVERYFVPGTQPIEYIQGRI